ncbi:MAG: hypothetical protein WA861_03665 [Candidatus Binatus sp.]
MLRNFLGTLTSRYSDWHGYWLFGFVVNDLERLDHDLLIPVAGSPDETPLAHLRTLATIKFLEQLSKAQLDPIRIREAILVIERLPGRVEVQYNPYTDPYTTSGYHVRFMVRAITDLGRAYEYEQIVAVAPHDPAHEFQSATWN